MYLAAVPYLLPYCSTAFWFCGAKTTKPMSSLKYGSCFSRLTTSLYLPTALTPKVLGAFLPATISSAFLMPENRYEYAAAVLGSTVRCHE